MTNKPGKQKSKTQLLKNESDSLPSVDVVEAVPNVVEAVPISVEVLSNAVEAVPDAVEAMSAGVELSLDAIKSVPKVQAGGRKTKKGDAPSLQKSEPSQNLDAESTHPVEDNSVTKPKNKVIKGNVKQTSGAVESPVVKGKGKGRGKGRGKGKIEEPTTELKNDKPKAKAKSKSKKKQIGDDNETNNENENEIEDATERRIRSFKVKLPNKEEFEGRFTGLTPYQAANKALSKYFRETQDPLIEITFSICESTRKSKKTVYTYVGKRQKLDVPVSYTIQDGREITKNFKNFLKKIKKNDVVE